MFLKNFISYIYHSSLSLEFNIYIHNIVKNIHLRKVIDIILIPLGIVKFIFLALNTKKESKNYKYNLSIICIMKNEASYVNEWLNYYISVGVDHFYIYDNDSIDNLRSILEQYGTKVTYHKMNGKLRQLDAYNDAINKYKYITKYMAFIDADEFIYCPLKEHKIFPVIDNILRKDSIGGLAVNWLIFGSSGYEKRPNGLITNNYIYRSANNFDKNHYIKTICNPRRIFYFSLSHCPHYLPGYHAVNERMEVTNGAISEQVSVKKIRINHYYSKSKQEFLLKRNRGSGDVLGKRRLAEFDEHDRNDVLDKSLMVYNKNHNLY